MRYERHSKSRGHEGSRGVKSKRSKQAALLAHQGVRSDCDYKDIESSPSGTAYLPLVADATSK